MSRHLEDELPGIVSRIEELEERVLRREPTMFDSRQSLAVTAVFDARSEVAKLKADMVRVKYALRVMAEVIEKQAGQIEGLVDTMAENGIE